MGLVDFFVTFGRRFVGEKRCPKWPTATPTILFPVAAILGWASRDDIKGTIAEPAYIMYGERLPCTVKGFPVVASYVAWRANQVLYGSCTLDIDSNNVGSCVFAHDCALGSEARAKEYGRPF